MDAAYLSTDPRSSTHAALNSKETAKMAKLTTKARKALPSSAFVFPGKRKDPIQDASHAHAALTMGMRDQSASGKAKIRSAVRRKYPGMMSGK